MRDFAREAQLAAKRAEGRRYRERRRRGLPPATGGRPRVERPLRQCSDCPFASRAHCDEWMASREVAS